MKTAFDKAMDRAKVNGVTKVTFREVSTQRGSGWCFDVYWDNRTFPNFISSAVKTNKGAVRNFNKYATTGKFSWYGNAE